MGTPFGLPVEPEVNMTYAVFEPFVGVDATASSHSPAGVVATSWEATSTKGTDGMTWR